MGTPTPYLFALGASRPVCYLWNRAQVKGKTLTRDTGSTAAALAVATDVAIWIIAEVFIWYLSRLYLLESHCEQLKPFNRLVLNVVNAVLKLLHDLKLRLSERALR